MRETSTMNPSTDSVIDFETGAPTAGSLDVAWIHGTRARRNTVDPSIQIHRYDEHTVIMRQSKSVNYEAPFIFLLFGNDRALLLDTGATADPQLFPLRSTVDDLISAWLSKHPREGYELVVAHTHGHGDHVAADAQFAGRPATTVVPREVDAMRSFFGFGDSWPAETVTLDLGGRVLEIIGSPGHHAAAITVYDPWTGILLTGDTVLPGRLYAFDYAEFLATLNRLVDFAGTRPVTHVFGCHVEMTSKPGRDYPLGATYQPDELAPQMTASRLSAIRDAAVSVTGSPGVHVFDDFIIYNEPTKRFMLKMMAAGMADRVRSAAGRR
jgi:hydroxyacylglutathione hydrolase